jgi:hypothetical protein
MKLFGLLVKGLGLCALLLIVGLAWLRFSEMRSDATVLEEGAPSAAESAEVAAEVEARFEAAVEEEAESVELTEFELASLLRHALNDELPGGITVTGVTLMDGEARVRGTVELSILPPTSWLDPVRRFLPEQVPVEIRSVVLTVEEGDAILLIRSLSVAGIPVPRSAYAAFLPELGGRGPGDLPKEALRLTLPARVESVRISEGRIVVGVPR